LLRNFVTVHNPLYYRQQTEEAHAAQFDGFANDIREEMGKLFWCDALIPPTESAGPSMR
jgi:NAD(P)H dehydrogenase (quinone)